ncbi:MAG: hypothetical protein Q8930_20195 [Bacillota bacterium]|nr:hypothetical protein [Bacillota bacterium]
MKRLETIKRIVEAGAVAVGTDGDLTNGVKNEDYVLITRTEAAFVEEVRKTRACC